MFRKIDLNIKPNFKVELLKNRREVIADVTEYVDKINYKLGDINTIEMSINKYIMRHGERVENKTYRDIREKMMLLVYLDDNIERYVLKDNTRTIDKNSGQKKFTAYSFEKTLESKRIEFFTDGESYPLVSDGVKSGVLDVVSMYSGWSIGYVDEMAKNESVYSAITNTMNIFKSYSKKDIQVDTLLWETDKRVSINNPDIPLYVTIEHRGMKRYDSYGDELTSDETYQTVLDPVHIGITNIKAYYHSEAGNRYGIRFEMTLADGSITKQMKEFTNLKSLSMFCSEINVIYETGEYANQLQTKYVWLESIDSDIYKFLTDMQEEFNVVFVFDSYNKVINCISKDNMNDESPIQLNYDSNVIKLDIKPVEEAISAIKVSGNDGLSIISVNKYGTDIIYNYSYYIENDLISDELKDSLCKYEVYLEEKHEKWLTLRDEKVLLDENKVKIDCEIKSLSERIKTVNELLAAYISSGKTQDEQKDLREELTQFESVFNENVKLRDEVNNKIFYLEEQIESLNNSIKRENCGIFSEDDILELNDIEIIETYTDDTATTSEALYNSANWYLNERTRPTVEFSVSCVNLLKVIKNKNVWKNIIKLGNLFDLDDEISREVKEKQVRLSSFSYDPKLNSVDNMNFTNKLFEVDKLKMAKKMQKKAIAVVMNNNAYKSTWKDSTEVNNLVYDIQNNGINMASTVLKTNSLYSVPTIEESEVSTNVDTVNNETNQEETNSDTSVVATYSLKRSISVFSDDTKEIVSNETESLDTNAKEEIMNLDIMENDIEESSAGIFIKNKRNPLQQLYIGASVFAFSNDGFRTSQISADSEGLVGKTIYGEILLGKRLYITSDDSSQTFYIGNMDTNEGFGLSIIDETTGEQRIFLGTELVDGIKKARLRLRGKNGEVAISEDGLVNTYCYIYHDDLDKDTPLLFDYPIDEGTFEVRSCKISIHLQKYRMTVKSLSSGGTVSTTSDGGAVISTTGNGGFYSNTYSSAESVDFGYNTYTSAQSENENGTHVHEYVYGVAKHSHLVTVNIEDHYHTMNIDAHHHEINTEHNHELEAGIFEATLPTNCSLYINDVLVASGINSNSSFDVKDYLEIGKDNTIKITSDTLGRIQLSILNKSFVTN